VSVLVDGSWLPVRDGDPRARALYLRHYSAEKGMAYRTGSPLFVAPGEKFVLLTLACDALFVWLRNTVQRWDRQEGVNCAAFRNESPARSSDLIREAMALAWARWPGQRLFTYVNPAKIRSTNPGYCFKQAGWRRCGESAQGLVILEALPAS
jgi:hypothetical protein